MFYRWKHKLVYLAHTCESSFCLFVCLFFIAIVSWPRTCKSLSLALLNHCQLGNSVLCLCHLARQLFQEVEVVTNWPSLRPCYSLYLLLSGCCPLQWVREGRKILKLCVCGDGCCWSKQAGLHQNMSLTVPKGHVCSSVSVNHCAFIR